MLLDLFLVTYFFMQELLVKEAYLVLPYKKKTYPFLVKQASFSEILEFDFYLKKDNEEIVQHIFDLMKKLNPDFTKEIFEQITPEQFSIIYKFFLKNYCTWFYEISEKKDKKDVKPIENIPFSSVIASIIANTNETMESLLKLTWEQITYLSQGLVYNVNEQSKEWKQENIRNKGKKELKDGVHDDVLKILREQREKVNAKFITNKK